MERKWELNSRFSSVGYTNLLARWNQLFEFMVVKYNDMIIKPTDKNGTFKKTPSGGRSQLSSGSPRYSKITATCRGEKYWQPTRYPCSSTHPIKECNAWLCMTGVSRFAGHAESLSLLRCHEASASAGFIASHENPPTCMFWQVGGFSIIWPIMMLISFKYLALSRFCSIFASKRI